MDNTLLVRRWFEEVWNQGRVETIDEMLSPRSMVHGLGEPIHGIEAFKAFHRAYRDAFPDVRIHIEQMVAEGDLVAARWTATGTHLGNGLGIAATSKPARFTGMVMFRFEDGRLVEGWNNFDQLGLFQQLGVVTLPG